MFADADPHMIARAAHVGIGSVALALFWVPLLAAKGRPLHRAGGRAALAALIVVVLGVGPLLFTRPGPFDPAWVIQFVYLVLCVVTVVRTGWRAITSRGDLAAFRDRGFAILGWTILVLGGVVLVAGIATGDPMTASFSVIGLFFGGRMVRFRAAPAPQGRWSLDWHLWSAALLFNAVHGTFLAVAWRLAVDPAAGTGVSLAAFWATMAAGIAIRWHYGRRFGAPIVARRAAGARLPV